MKKLEGLQWLRAIAALAVVAFHVEITMAKQKYFGLPTFPLANVGFFGVHLFFVLSGFVIFWAHTGDLGQPKLLLQYFWKRVRRLMPPLWLLLLPLLAIWVMRPDGVGSKELSAFDFASAFLILPVPSIEVLDVEWTLRHEIAFYLFFSLLILNVWVGGLVLVLWFVICLVSPFGLSPYLGILMAEVNILFLFGVAVYFAVKRLGLRANKWVVALTVVAWCVAVYVGFLTGANVHGSSSIYLFGPPSALAVFCVATCDFSFRGLISMLMEGVGDASYAIYLVHFPVVSVLCKLTQYFKSALPQEVWFLLIFAMSVLVGQLFHVVAERPIVRRLAEYKVG